MSTSSTPNALEPAQLISLRHIVLHGFLGKEHPDRDLLVGQALAEQIN